MTPTRPRIVKVLLGVQAVLIAIITGFLAGIFTSAAGAVVVTALAAGGAAFLVAVPVVLGIQKAISD
jgi:hypothetical protein